VAWELEFSTSTAAYQQERKAMKIDFDGIQALVQIAEPGGFSRAGERLYAT
jgi:hypothetical protein